MNRPGRYLTEFIGTFFLVLFIGLAVAKAGPLAPIAIGVGLMCVVYMGGHVSGAHYNPAVTVAVWMRGKLPTAEVAPYMIFQILGAAIAAYAVRTLVPGFDFVVAPAATTGLVLSTGGMLLAEVLVTFLLALVVLHVATHPATAKNSYYGFAIGGVVLAGAFAAGPISGGAFNPAVGVGTNLVAAVRGTEQSLSHTWIYIVGPVLGAVLAALTYRAQGGHIDPARS